VSHPKVRVGTAYLLIAQGIFLITSYVLHVTLGRFLGPVEYGLFGVVLYAATMVRTFVGSGFPMAVARYVSSEPPRAEAIFRKGLQLQLILATGVGLIFFLSADFLAALLGDPALASLFRVAAPITVFYGVFFLLIQYYNGLRQYRVQSAMLSIYYVLRAGFAIGLALLGLRVFGAIGGIVGSVAIVAFVFLILRKPGEASDPFPASSLIKFSMPLLLAAIVQSLLIDIDLMFVKKLVANAPSAGYYTSAKTMAQITLFAFFALSNALYPAISSAYSQENTEKLKDYIQQAHRLLLVVILPLFLLVFWDAAGLIRLFYGSKYLQGAPSLQWLMLSFSLMALFIIHKTVITGCGFPKVASVITLGLLPICVTLHLILIPIHGIVGAAMASTITSLCGVIVSMTIIYSKFKAGFMPFSTLRIIIAALVIFGMDILFSGWGVHLVPKLAILALLYLIVLRLLGEWKLGELRDLFRQFYR